MTDIMSTAADITYLLTLLFLGIGATVWFVLRYINRERRP